MKLKKLELTIIAITLAFGCFTGGFFAGRRSSVNIIQVQQERGTAAAGAIAETGTVRTDTPEEEPSEPTASLESELPPENNAPLLPDTAEMPFEPESEGTENEVKAGETAGETAVESEPSQTAPESDNTEIGEPYGGDYRKIDINNASKAELIDLPGIGDVLADRIIEYRNKNGKFRNISDITKVSGIGEKKFEAMRDYIYAG